jgi:hypothetical protein
MIKEKYIKKQNRKGLMIVINHCCWSEFHWFCVRETWQLDEEHYAILELSSIWFSTVNQTTELVLKWKKMRRKWKLVTTYLVTTSVNGFHVQRCCNSFFNVYFISSSSFFIIFFSKCYSFFLSFIFWVFYIFFFVSFTAILISFEGQVVSVSSQSQFASIKNKFSFTNSRFIYFVSPSNVTLIVANLYVRGGHK